MASNLVSGAIFKIKIALLSFLFQLLSGCIGLKSESLNGTTKVAIGDKNFLTTFKIAKSSGVASVFFSLLLVALCDVSLDTFFDDIKSALGIFGVVISVKLKPAGLWQYAVVYFKDTFSAVATLTYWSKLVRKNSIRIFLIINQNNVISSKNAFKTKLVNIFFGCTAFEISDLVSQVDSHRCFIFRSPESYQFATSGGKLLDIATITDVSLLLPPKFSSNAFSDPKIFKPLFVRSKSYAKAVVFVVFSVAAAVTR
ncbi:hypothetical protein G9A89_019803 [Geosiphon pyriformis]|nr:hypothetical protein G9A89_019803 [Geosiphon pyriformis]